MNKSELEKGHSYSSNFLVLTDFTKVMKGSLPCPKFGVVPCAASPKRTTLPLATKGQKYVHICNESAIQISP
jgi:hypothetical protein